MTDETRPHKMIGRYIVLDELGRGGMGIAYRALDPVIGRQVALKTIAFDVAGHSSNDLKKRLYREAAAAGTLAHPNIVTVFDVVEQGQTIAIALELVEGESVQAIIDERGPLGMDEALDILEQVCSALDFASERAIVHRDIKPANIRLTKSGAVKVMDFGIARLDRSEMTAAGVVLGSPGYMSPEQVRGLPLDGRSDLFSAAVVFYEMITGKRPFAGSDIATTMYRIVHEAPAPAWQVNPGISRETDAVLAKALAKDPADRYQNGAALVAALREAHGRAGRGSEVPVVPVTGAWDAQGGPAGSLEGPGPVTAAWGGPATAATPASAPEAGSTTSLGLGAARSSGGPSAAVSAGTDSAVISPGADAPAAAPSVAASSPPVATAAPGRASPPRAARRFPAVALVAALAIVAVAVAGGAAWWVLGRQPSASADATLERTDQAIPALPAEPPPQAPTMAAGEPIVPPPAPAESATPVQATSAPGPSTAASGGGPQPAAGAKAAKGAAGGGRGTKAAPGADTARPPTDVPTSMPAPAEPVVPEPAASAPMPSETFEVTQVDVRPVVVRQVPPEYPEEARREGLKDIIVLRALINVNGQVVDARIVRRAQKEPAFERAALAAIRQWSFTPAQRRGKPVACWLPVGVPFTLPQ